jgi:hypothetical protein
MYTDVYTLKCKMYFLHLIDLTCNRSLFQEQHHNEPFDDDVNLFDEDASFQENPTSEEDGNDEEVCYNFNEIEINLNIFEIYFLYIIDLYVSGATS